MSSQVKKTNLSQLYKYTIMAGVVPFNIDTFVSINIDTFTFQIRLS